MRRGSKSRRSGEKHAKPMRYRSRKGENWVRFAKCMNTARRPRRKLALFGKIHRLSARFGLRWFDRSQDSVVRRASATTTAIPVGEAAAPLEVSTA